MIISMVPTDLVDVVWAEVRPILARAVKTIKSKFFVDDIRDAAKRGELMVWVVMDGRKIIASFTTRIIDYPAGHAMAMDWVAGERMNEWLDEGLAIMEKYAREYHCKHLEGYGRKAWARVMGKRGWEPEYIAFRKDLDHE